MVAQEDARFGEITVDTKRKHKIQLYRATLCEEALCLDCEEAMDKLAFEEAPALAYEEAMGVTYEREGVGGALVDSTPFF